MARPNATSANGAVTQAAPPEMLNMRDDREARNRVLAAATIDGGAVLVYSHRIKIPEFCAMLPNTDSLAARARQKDEVVRKFLGCRILIVPVLELHIATCAHMGAPTRDLLLILAADPLLLTRLPELAVGELVGLLASTELRADRHWRKFAQKSTVGMRIASRCAAAANMHAEALVIAAIGASRGCSWALAEYAFRELSDGGAAPVGEAAGCRADAGTDSRAASAGRTSEMARLLSAMGVDPLRPMAVLDEAGFL